MLGECVCSFKFFQPKLVGIAWFQAKNVGLFVFRRTNIQLQFVDKILIIENDDD